MVANLDEPILTDVDNKDNSSFAKQAKKCKERWRLQSVTLGTKSKVQPK